MTLDELLTISPLELEKMSDEELSLKLSPLFPAVRTEYVGPKTESIVVQGKVRSRKQFENSLSRLAKLVNYQPPT